MTMPRLAPTYRRPLARQSAHLVSWQARGLSVDADTGQAGVATFAASANVIASDATTFAAVAGMPRWQMQDLQAVPTGRESPTLWLGVGDTLAWTVAPRLTGVTLSLQFVQPSVFPTVGTGLLYLGTDAVSGTRLYLDSTGSQYRVTHHNGTSPVTSTMTGTAPTSGQLVTLRATLASTGAVQVHQTIGEDDETSATASGTLAVVALSAASRLRLNGIGTANTTAYAARRAWLSPGTTWTPTTLEWF